VQNGTGTTVGSRYVGDAGYTVTGSLRDGILSLRAPVSVFGGAVGAGSRVYSVAAFALAGPTEADPTGTLVANSMRTLDQSPPFDGTLQRTFIPPTLVDCTDGSIQEEGGWHTLQDSR